MRATDEKIDAIRAQLEQAQNHLKLLENRERDMERRERTRRLIERGAILESLIDKPQAMSNDQIKTLLHSVLPPKTTGKGDSLA